MLTSAEGGPVGASRVPGGAVACSPACARCCAVSSGSLRIGPRRRLNSSGRRGSSTTYLRQMPWLCPCLVPAPVSRQWTPVARRVGRIGVNATGKTAARLSGASDGAVT